MSPIHLAVTARQAAKAAVRDALRARNADRSSVEAQTRLVAACIEARMAVGLAAAVSRMFAQECEE